MFNFILTMVCYVLAAWLFTYDDALTTKMAIFLTGIGTISFVMGFGGSQ